MGRGIDSLESVPSAHSVASPVGDVGGPLGVAVGGRSFSCGSSHGPILPGEFLATGEPPLQPFLDQLRSSALRAPRPVLHEDTPLPTSLPAALMQAEMVIVRRDATAPPLAPPYAGPYRVLRRSLHAFTLQIGG